MRYVALALRSSSEGSLSLCEVSLTFVAVQSCPWMQATYTDTASQQYDTSTDIV